MATWECAECTTVYSVGAPKCPQCGSTVRVNEQTRPEEEQDMAKITVHGGPSNAAADEEQGGEDAPVSGESAASAEGSPEPGYEDWTAEQLKAELDKRGLPKTGKKDDLAARLREDDTARTAEPGAE